MNDADKFLSKVDRQEGGCWLWTGHVGKNGYGQFAFSRKATPAHRASYILFVRKLSSGEHVDHLCRNRRCVRPDHLEAVSPAENNRRSQPFREVVTHCPQGHEYTEENTYIYKGRRNCNECRRVRVREAMRQYRVNGGKWVHER